MKWEREDLRLDLIGLRVGSLTVIEYLGSDETGRSLWKTKCDCGGEKIVIGKEFKRGKGGKKCNDCHLKEKSDNAKQHGDSNTKFYNIWVSLRKRCGNKSNLNYGGRGITYDSRWINYNNFKKDMYFKYLYAKRQLYKTDNLSIERRDVNKNYCFDNCEFIPLNFQQGNTRKIKWFRAISPKGKIYIYKNAAKFARLHKLNANRVRECLREECNYHKKWKFKYI